MDVLRYQLYRVLKLLPYSQKAKLQSKSLYTESFRLRLYLPVNPIKRRQAVVYIEGDGLAWIDR